MKSRIIHRAIVAETAPVNREAYIISIQGIELFMFRLKCKLKRTRMVSKRSKIMDNLSRLTAIQTDFTKSIGVMIQLSMDLSKKLKEDGMQRAVDHANTVTTGWSEKAYDFLKGYIKIIHDGRCSIRISGNCPFATITKSLGLCDQEGRTGRIDIQA